MRRARLFLLGLLLVSLVEATRQWNSAPGRVPSHFDASGRPNAWSSRDQFFMLQIGVTLGIAALFIGIPWLLKSTPASLINLPNKSYWLAPEQREETMDRLASYFDAFACATVLLLLAVFELTSLASHGGGLATNYFLPVLVSYLVFTAGWTVALIRAFANARATVEHLHRGARRCPHTHPSPQPDAPGLDDCRPLPPLSTLVGHLRFRNSSATPCLRRRLSFRG